jgi:hypothetical protein
MKTSALAVLLLLTAVGCGPVRSQGDGGLPVQTLVDGGVPPGEVEEPLPDASTSTPDTDAGMPADGGVPVDGGTTPDAGAPLQYAYPAWTREDVQPKSPKYKQVYGLEQFRGGTLVVVLLEGYCPYCNSNAGIAEQLQVKLRSENRDVEIVVLGDANASELVKSTGLPVFQDNSPGRAAWGLMRSGASKHDTFVFAPNGQRTLFWAGTYTGDATKWTTEIGAEVRRLAPSR